MRTPLAWCRGPAVQDLVKIQALRDRTAADGSGARVGSQVSRSSARTATGSGHAEKCSGRWSWTECVSNTRPHAASAVCCPEGRLGGRPSGRLGALTRSLASPHAASARCLDRDSEDAPRVSRTAGSQGSHLPEADARSPRQDCGCDSNAPPAQTPASPGRRALPHPRQSLHIKQSWAGEGSCLE